MTRAEFIEDGFATPEEAARGDIPPQYARVVGVEIDGDSATVSLPTNEAPRFEPYQVGCERHGGLWFATWGLRRLHDRHAGFRQRRGASPSVARQHRA
jgi:hypothetical protein